jgi:hypothetical protein
MRATCAAALLLWLPPQHRAEPRRIRMNADLHVAGTGQPPALAANQLAQEQDRECRLDDDRPRAETDRRPAAT